MKLYLLVLYFCFANAAIDQNSIFSRLASKTPYRFVANDNTTVPENLASCAKKIWMFVRHGTRNPSKNDILFMAEDLPKIRDRILEENDNLTDSEIELFRKWVPNVTDVEVNEYLVPEGEVENVEMAQRMQARYPQLLPPFFDNGTYRIRYTAEQRTHESAKHFAKGLFGEQNLADVYLPEATKDELLILRFYKYCTKWKREIDDNPEAWIQQTSFEQSEVMNLAVAEISYKLGLHEPLPTEDVLLIYKTCAFETAWFRDSISPWCLPFDVNTIKVLEYNDDLEYYWIDGYGHELTYKQACNTFRDMIDFFDNQSNRTATLYFTHSGAIAKFIAHLGLYEDSKPPLYTNYGTNDDRLWRVSKTGSFATNVAFILHNCGDSKKISVLHNEHPIRLPACPNDDLCSLDTIRAYYDDSINHCDFDEMCENTSVGSSFMKDVNFCYLIVLSFVVLMYLRKE